MAFWAAVALAWADASCCARAACSAVRAVSLDSSAARACYGFDQNRAAVLLCGGLKTDPKMYESAIATAERELAGHKAAIDAAKMASADAAKKAKRQKKSQ